MSKIPSYKKRKSPPKRKKVVIDYPEVPTRTWIPPDARRKVVVKPPQEKYKKPEGLDQKLDISSLKKMWCQFEIIGDRAVLPGTISQNSKKFTAKTRGYQAPANVVVAITYSQMYEMQRWKSHYVDKILSTGDALYLDSRRHLQNPHREIITLYEVYKTFFIGKEKITVDIKKDGVLKGSATLGNIANFGAAVNDFFTKEYSCVIIYQKKYYALWKQSRGFYLFDPYECTKEGVPWAGLAHQGVACLMKFVSIGVIVNHIISCSLECDSSNGEFSVTPVYIQRIVSVNTNYPDCLKDANLEVKPPPEKDILLPDGKHRGRPEKPEEVDEKEVDEESEEEPEPVVLPGDVDEETIYTEYESRADTASRRLKLKEKEKKVKIPEKREPELVSYYITVIPDRISILRAPTHQCNPNFSKYLGQQSFANAYSAIAMLHIYKAKLWTTKTMEDVLKNAEQIHHDSLKTLTGDQNMKVRDVSNKITCSGVDFTPKVIEYAAVGRLNSDKEDVSDLSRALAEVLSSDDACIITGPLILAVWIQEGQYYMWDPNERDEKGVTIVYEETKGAFKRKSTCEIGLGCVTSFKQIKDMVLLYLLNTPRAKRRDNFILSKIEMEDFTEEPPNWFNFKAIRPDKWVLCGSFNQSDVRFPRALRNTQCTAMAAMFLAYLHLTNIKEWNTEQIDEILVSGNDYYGNCVNNLKEKGNYHNPLLMAAELLFEFDIGSKKLKMTLEELCVYGTLSRFKDVGFGHSFKQGLKHFFEENDYGILTSSGLSVAIFKVEDGYYVGDSHSRNETGRFTSAGTAVVVRHLSTDELANSIEMNYYGSTDPSYNIHRVTYEVWDADEDGAIRPPLNNYIPISNYVAILRSLNSQDNPTLYPLTFGKQQVPMGLVVLGMIKLTAPAIWSVSLVDELLNVGDKYYKTCIEQFYKEIQKRKYADNYYGKGAGDKYTQRGGGDANLNQGFVDASVDEEGTKRDTEVEAEEEEDSDAITSRNVVQEFMIGINKFTLDLEESKTGVIVDLPLAIQNFYGVPDVEETDQRELLIESNPLTVALWRDNGLYYYFDPKPRDERGHVYGKDEWTLISPEELALLSEFAEEIYEDNEQEEGAAKENRADVVTYEENAEEAQENPDGALEDLNVAMVQEEAYADDAFVEGGAEGEGDDKNPMEQEIALAPKHSPSYWKRQEIDGTACVIWFTELDQLINHVIENIPPRQRSQQYRLTHVKMNNVVFTKDVYDPESGPKETNHDGDWYNFKEVTHGQWILRATSSMREIIFPICNRGRQYIAITFAAAAYVRLYALSKFKIGTVESILKYGDKLHTCTRRVHKTTIEGRQKELKRVCAMTKEELDAIMNLEHMDINIVVRNFCIGEHRILITVTENLLQGELYQDNPQILSLTNALDAFFGSAGVYAVLQTKGVHLFITKYHGAYFFFDPDCRGPSGNKSTSGDACFSRHLDLNLMCSLIVSNLPVEGSNAFWIHSLSLQVQPCERVIQIEEIAPTAPLRISGFHSIVPGKRIISGSISIESEKYVHMEKDQSASVNLVALAMTLIHRTENWTKAIIDETVRIGAEVYQEQLDSYLSNHNKFEQRMTIFLATTDFKIGSIQVNCQLRNSDQRGIVDMKSARVPNLRIGLEQFFLENTHGIISTYDLIMAVWKPEGQTRIFMFDAFSRGKAGMPAPAAQGGAACVLSFDTPKLAADHFVALTPEFGRRGAYVVVPVEIVVAKAGRRKGTKKAMHTKQEKVQGEQQKHKEEQKERRHGRQTYHELHAEKLAILRADRSQNSKYYSENSRGKQDLANCVISYIMDKMQPLAKWNFSILHQILDIGDQVYKDSVVMFNPTDPKLGLEALQRSIVMFNINVKFAIGKPIMANNFSVENVLASLEVFFGSREFCLLNVRENWLGLFKKHAQYYMFDPQDIDAKGKRMEGFGEGHAAIMRFDHLELMVEQLVRNIHCDYSVFFLNVIAIKDVVKMIPKK